MGVAAVTGSASGIGAAVRRRLESDGDRVVGVDLHDAEVEADLSTRMGRNAATKGVLDACGGRLDRLVLCAGLGSHVDDLSAIVSVNYFGTVELLDSLLEALRCGERPAAVAICSNAAQIVAFDDHPLVKAMLAGDEAGARDAAAAENGFVAYAASKHALSRALRRRAVAWGDAGVRLNGIAPGATETPLLRGTEQHPVWGRGLESLAIPLGRRAQPDEIATIVAFLLGPGADYVHGSIWYADGGTDAAIRPDRF